MRNLQNIGLTEAICNEKLPLRATAWDAATDSIICAFGPCESSAVIELKKKVNKVNNQQNGIRQSDPPARDHPSPEFEWFQSIASWDAPCPLPDLACDKILSLQYFPDIQSAYLVLAGGDIIVVREKAQPGEDKIEIVGSVDAGISAVAWSPDEELLAITTRANTLLYMTRELENVVDIHFSPEDLKASYHVSVGWGKKETQFKGKRVKALRDPTMPETVDEGKLSASDDGRTRITWRGDGSFVAVNSVEAGTRRVIRIYSRDGSLDSVSEPVDGLESALSWRPAGNLIAGVQRLPDRVDVVFFERNGLRHGQFPLRLTKDDMDSWASKVEVCWNIDSTVLAVCFQDRLQLWTMGNYHYYLKQEIPVQGVSPQSGFPFRWHPEKPLRFAVGSAWSVLDLDFVFDVSRGSTSRPHDFGIVSVIDGRTLKLTPFRLANVPPPMASCEVDVDDNIIDVALSQSGSKIAILTSSNVYLFEWDFQARPVSSPRRIDTFLHKSSLSTRCRQISFRQERELYILQHSTSGHSTVEMLSLESNLGDFSPEVVISDHDCRYINTLFPTIGSHDNDIFVTVGAEENIIRFYNLTAGPNSRNLIKPGHCITAQGGAPWVEAVQYGSDPQSKHVIFALSRTGSLFANERLLAKKCTSFLVTPIHLIFTTAQHLLKFVHIADVDELEVPGDTPETDERCRSIERGARLITVIPSTFSLTLQMPRGNLETIYPRALVLAGIRQYIDERDYKSAFLACRNHMVDMNILHDYAPAQFMSNVQLFVDQVKKIDRIDDFLSRLKDEDVTQTLYRDTLQMTDHEVVKPRQDAEVGRANTPPHAVQPGVDQDQKVNRICDEFLHVLKPRMDTNLQNVVTAYVCKRPPDLEAGLLLVAGLRGSSAEQSEQGIEHLCFLTDVNKLYDTALGLYDLDLTLLVAQQSQKDPREYLPFLQRLQEMPELRRRYELDDYLRRYVKALKDLHGLQEDEEVKSYAIKHILYREALELYKYQSDQLNEMTRIYADYLHEHSHFKAAAIAYESLELHTQAYQSYQLAHLWRESLFCAQLIPLPPNQLSALASALSETLLTSSTPDYFSAATIHAEHLHDIPTAAKFLCRGYHFSNACRLLALHNLASLLPSIIDVGLTDKMAEVIELLADCKSQLNAQVPRIRELRLKKAQDPLAFFGGDKAFGDGPDIPDNVSLAPTDASTMGGGSLFTRYARGGNTSAAGSSVSRKTSKTRRREERKRARGKKGSVYEEEYLVNSVGRLIERVNAVGEDVGRLVEGLMRRGMRERAGAVEAAMVEIVGLCRGCVSEVFEPGKEDMGGTTGEGKEGLSLEDDGRPSGADGVFWDSQIEEKKEPPVVKEFERLSLLGA